MCLSVYAVILLNVLINLNVAEISSNYLWHQKDSVETFSWPFSFVSDLLEDRRENYQETEEHKPFCT